MYRTPSHMKISNDYSYKKINNDYSCNLATPQRSYANYAKNHTESRDLLIQHLKRDLVVPIIQLDNAISFSNHNFIKK